MARTLFELADDDKSGYLDMNEVAQVEARLLKKFPAIVLDPPFDLEVDFAAMDQDGAGRVSWDEFEKWWVSRSGDPEPSCPVLPEGMVTKIDEAAPIGGGSHWDFLRPRLKLLVALQQWWGSVHQLSSGGSESLFPEEVLPPYIRGPDSAFT